MAGTAGPSSVFEGQAVDRAEKLSSVRLVRGSLRFRRLSVVVASGVATAIVLIVAASGSAAPPEGAGKPDRATVLAYGLLTEWLMRSRGMFRRIG